MTSGSDGRTGGWYYERDPSDSTRLGISFSGGGIRSATFSLGVYQHLAEAGLFRRAQYLSAVSGGGYLAAGLAISHANSGSSPGPDDPPPWGRGSAEEARLRDNLTYLAPGGVGRLWLGANLVYGVILNLAPLILAAYVLGHVLGYILSRLYPGIGSDDPDFANAKWVAAAAGAAVVAAIVAVGVRRFHDRQGSSQRAWAQARHVSTFLLVLAAAMVVFLAAIPLVVNAFKGWTSGWLDTLPRSSRQQVIGLIGVTLALVLGGVAVWLYQRRRLRYTRSALAGIAGAGILIVPFLLATETGATRSWHEHVVQAIAACLAIALFGVLSHNRRYSMHLFYRERIQEAFTSRRTTETVDGRERVVLETIPYAEPIRLSEVAATNAARNAAGDPFPQLVICAAVAARGSEVPNKAWASSFTFEGKKSGSARLGLRAPTTFWEGGDWIGGGGLTLPSMMAISGAALSPLMGRFTLPAFRFLMAMLNIRLGVWVRNPKMEIEAELPPRTRPVRRALRWVVRGWEEPGAWYVLKEGLGLAGAGGKFVYVSDGGHWENLGLTELLRRGCTDIIAVDASGTKGLDDIGRAMAVARAELGVEFKLDPRATAPDEDGVAEAPVAVGEFEYPDGTRGAVFFARCVLWDGAPADLQMFPTQDKRFPNHPTSNQFLSGDVFDAYRALGYAVGGALAEKIHLPPEPSTPRRFTSETERVGAG